MKSKYQSIDPNYSDELETPSLNNEYFNYKSSAEKNKYFSSNLHAFFVMICIALIGLFIFYSSREFVFGSFDTLGYDYIIIVGGPAGSVISSKLVNTGAKVLLIEAGTATQRDLGGRDYFAGPVTRFDIPMLWYAFLYIVIPFNAWSKKLK